MFPVIASARRPVRGFTLIEIMIVVIMLGVVLAVGLPQMANWVRDSRSTATVEFYSEGMALARRQAQMHNTPSRIVFTRNNVTNNFNWQVDICFPTAALACTPTVGNWSTPTAPATGDPEGAAGYVSVKQRADKVSLSSDYAVSLLPLGNGATFFQSNGWLDNSANVSVTTINFDPSLSLATALPKRSLRVTLAGTAIKCNPDPAIVAPDSRACPP